MTAHGLKGYVGNERSSLSHRWYRQPVLRNRHHVVFCTVQAVLSMGMGCTIRHVILPKKRMSHQYTLVLWDIYRIACKHHSLRLLWLVPMNARHSRCSELLIIRAVFISAFIRPVTPVHPSHVFVITNITMCCTYKRPQRDTCVTFAGQCHGLDDKAFIPTVVSVSAYFTPTPFCIVLISASISDDQLAAGDIYHLMYSPGTVIFPPHESSNLA